jgi:hypothetical protein
MVVATSGRAQGPRGAAVPAPGRAIVAQLQAQRGSQVGAVGYGLDAKGVAGLVDLYLPDPDTMVAHPYASPLLAPELSALPPAHVMSAERDPLRDDGQRYAGRLRDAGVPATFSRRKDISTDLPRHQRSWSRHGRGALRHSTAARGARVGCVHMGRQRLREARDRLLELREFYGRAVAEFSWPEVSENFNFAHPPLVQLLCSRERRGSAGDGARRSSPVMLIESPHPGAVVTLAVGGCRSGWLVGRRRSRRGGRAVGRTRRRG